MAKSRHRTNGVESWPSATAHGTECGEFYEGSTTDELKVTRDTTN